MSTACTHSARLAVSGDPTNTQAIRERFVRAFRRRFRALRGAIRRAVGYEDDVFGLRARLGADDVEDFPRDESTVGEFVRWLREQIQAGILEPLDLTGVRRGQHWTATFVRAAYGRGWENATGRLLQQGVDAQNRDLDVVFNLPTPRRQLQELYTRVYSNLQDISVEMAQPIREELTRGLAEGVNPKEMARRLTDEVRDLQRTRAETLARTEVINSYSEATLDRYEDAGVDVVRHGEWATADDDRVCPICESLDGKEFAIDELRAGTFTFEPSESEPDHLAGEYRLKPPAHPNGRCTILPVIA